MQQWHLQGNCPTTGREAPAHAFANPVGLLQDFHQTSLLTYIAFLDGRVDG